MLIRGLNVVVLNEVTGDVMSSRWYDTYESKADSGFLVNHLKGLRRGRIICFAIKVFMITVFLLKIAFFFFFFFKVRCSLSKKVWLHYV